MAYVSNQACITDLVLLRIFGETDEENQPGQQTMLSWQTVGDNYFLAKIPSTSKSGVQVNTNSIWKIFSVVLMTKFFL